MSQNSTELIDSIKALIADVNVAGISIHSDYDSTTLTVTPPAGTINEEKAIGAGLFELPDGREAVTIDSWGSQANRFEAAIKRDASKLGFPIIALTNSGEEITTSLDWSHRHVDTTWKLASTDAAAAGIPVGEIRDSNRRNAVPLLKYFPASVLFGWWDSHTQNAKAEVKAEGAFKAYGLDETEATKLAGHGRASDDRRSARILTSEIIAKGVKMRPRFAARVDSLFGAVKKVKSFQMSKHGIGSIPPSSGPIDVTFESIEGRSFLSFAILRRFDFGELDEVGKVAIALLGLAGVVGSKDDLHLRVGSDLTLRTRDARIERHLAEPVNLDLPEIDVIAEALRSLAPQLGWNAYEVPVSNKFVEVVSTIKGYSADTDEEEEN